MLFNASISVKNGATLRINSGCIENADIVVESGGTLELTNDGIIKLNTEDKLDVHLGAELEMDHGEVIKL